MSLLIEILKALVTGVSGGLTLGLSQYIADEYVKPFLKKLREKHLTIWQYIKEEIKISLRSIRYVRPNHVKSETNNNNPK